MTVQDVSDSSETILDGLAYFGEKIQNEQIVRSGAVLYKSLIQGFSSSWNPKDSCILALPALIIRPEIRTDCFVAISTSSVVIVWKKGLIKKSIESKVVALDAISNIRHYMGDNSATRGASLVAITAGEQITIALPNQTTQLAQLVVNALRQVPNSKNS